MKTTHKTISAYNAAQTKADKEICELLRIEIARALKNSESKIWHGSPVWFLDGNPIVGYSRNKSGVQLLFWSGKSFDETDLLPLGVNKAAHFTYVSPEQVKITLLRKWLTLSKKIQWNYKDIVKNKGVLTTLLNNSQYNK
ncbi:MAG: DUF1801 domain-containing protein [Bdellovibrionales bacterium]